MNKERFSAAARRHGGLWGVLALLWVALLSGCGGGVTDSATTSDSGELQVALKDAPGDFLTYRVDVTALKLTRANGAVVQALPATTTIDFAQYVDLSELLTVATVPSGRYDAVQVTLDYSNADIQVENEAGVAVSAQPVDGAGQPLTSVTVDVALQGDGRFVVAPGVPALVTLDFDLNASNTVTLAGDSATVTVQPTLVVDSSISPEAEMHVRGLLAGVDAVGQRFRVNMRPFHQRIRDFGAATVHTTDATVFEINGVAYAGSEGLAQLALLQGVTPVVTSGMVDTTNRSYTATEVLAGSSVPWSGRDVARGVVVARSGNTLTLRGASMVTASGAVTFGDTLVVVLGETTTVTRAGSAENFGIADVSVGQAVSVTGLREGDSIDATEGHVRMRVTEVSGTVNSNVPLALSVQRIEGRAVALFDFAGTGVDAANDADAAHYEIDTGSLDLSALQAGDPVRLRGFVAPFGAAPADFAATTVTDLSEVSARMTAGYGSAGSDAAVLAIDASGLQLAPATGDAHYLVRNGVQTDLLTLPAMPRIVPSAAGTGIFSLVRAGEVRVFPTFADFATALTVDLDAGVKVEWVGADGLYDDAINVLNVSRVSVRLVP